MRLVARFWAALLVLTVALSAVAPIEAPLDVRSGSAFSADTVEVAIAPARQGLAVQRVVQLPAPLPLLPLAPLAILAALPLLASARDRWPAPTGPPSHAPLLARKIAPRGPPIA